MGGCITRRLKIAGHRRLLELRAHPREFGRKTDVVAYHRLIKRRAPFRQRRRGVRRGSQNDQVEPADENGGAHFPHTGFHGRHRADGRVRADDERCRWQGPTSGRAVGGRAPIDLPRAGESSSVGAAPSERRVAFSLRTSARHEDATSAPGPGEFAPSTRCAANTIRR